jgi:formamidopyrimidine-DNA glycosylase
MPELPEVETIKNDLKKAILNKKIVEVEAREKKIIKSNFQEFPQDLKGNAFRDISRIGKLMIFKLKNKKYLLIHLKMTGQLIYKPHFKTSPRPSPCQEEGESENKRKKNVIAGGHEIPGMDDKLPNKHTHVIFKFADKSVLYFNDMRRFGYLKLADEEELKKIKAEYGVEPLSRGFTLKRLREVLKGRKNSVKAVLMDQSLIAGIGNIYADEILFKAGVMPSRAANTLGEEEIKKIFRAIKFILKKAIKYRGTTFSDYVDSKGKKGNFTRFLDVYKREGERCKRCGNVIKKMKIGGRGARYCPECQK